MAGEKYADRAVEKLRAHCAANLQTYLTAVETAQGLAAGAMVPPVAYEGSTFDDGRSPLVLVDCPDGAVESWEDGLFSYGCSLFLVFNGGADVHDGQQQARRYLTALIDMIRAAETLGATVEYAQGGGQQLDAETTGDKTRHAVAVEVMVRIHEPT